MLSINEIANEYPQELQIFKRFLLNQNLKFIIDFLAIAYEKY